MTSNELEIFKQSILDEVRVMMQTTGQVTQYIGARYVPLFAEPLDWDIEREYEPMTIVLHQGNSFTSRQFVPKGIDISNSSFWAKTGNYNAQIEQYRKEVQALSEKMNELEPEIRNTKLKEQPLAISTATNINSTIVNNNGGWQPTIDDVTFSNNKMSSAQYGFIVGNEENATSNNITVFNSAINSKLGNRSRPNTDGLNEFVKFLFNYTKTTGNTNDSVGIELWTKDSLAVGNHIEGSGTGYSGITTSKDNTIAALNIIKEFTAGIEAAGSHNIVGMNVIENCKYGIYQGEPKSDSLLVDGCIFKNVNTAVYQSPGTSTLNVTNCMFSCDSGDGVICYARRGLAPLNNKRVFFSNCVFYGFKSCDIQNVNQISFKNCVFINKQEHVITFNTNADFIGCSFINAAISIGSGKSIISGCSFTGYSSIKNGCPISKGSGYNPTLIINSCKFDNGGDGVKLFTNTPTAEFAIYDGGILDGQFVTYNKSAEEIVNLPNFKALIGGKQMIICYDTYLNKAYMYLNNQLKEITFSA